jgi:hypothetical protein
MNKIANGILPAAGYRVYQCLLHLQNVILFNGTGVNVISFEPIRKLERSLC